MWPEEEPHKVAKIVPYPDGGYAVLVPYHKERSGFAAKFAVDYKKVRVYEVDEKEYVSFGADERVKFSYHTSGFAQFSGENPRTILSGREGDQIKGVGILTQPPHIPIKTGPTLGLLFWGIDEFDALPPGAKAEVFGEGDFYHGGGPELTNACLIEIFHFETRFWSAVRKSNDSYILTMVFQMSEAAGAARELRVLELPGQSFFLGVLVSRTRASFEASSGWVINGPSVITDQHEKIGEQIVAFYPKEAVPGKTISGSINFSPPTQET